MKNKLYQYFLNLSAATLVCAAVLVGNASLTVPLPNGGCSQAEIVVQENEGEPGIMPLNDSKSSVNDFG